MLKFALLGFINYRPLTGYQLGQIIERSTGYFWHAKVSQIYITLKAMKDEGLVSVEIEPQEERPDRNVYSITPAGRSALHSWLQQPVTEIKPRKDELLLKLFFSARVDKELLLAQLRLLQNLHQNQLDEIQTQAAGQISHFASLDPHLKKDALFWNATRRFGELYEEMTLQWLHETIRLFEEEL